MPEDQVQTPKHKLPQISKISLSQDALNEGIKPLPYIEETNISTINNKPSFLLELPKIDLMETKLNKDELKTILSNYKLLTEYLT